MSFRPAHAIVAIGAATALLPLSAPTPAEAATAAESTATFYSTKQPYSPQASIESYSPAPDGFEQIYTASVNRHGSRGLSSWKYDDLAEQMLQAAAAEGQLTELGERLIPQVRALHAANEQLTGPDGASGYGNLTEVGCGELRDIGKRNAQRNQWLFDGAHDIAVTSSGQDRATESAELFLDGLGRRADITETPELLYAHKDKSAESFARYSEWKNGEVVKAKVRHAHESPAAREAAVGLLSHIFTPEFLESLDDRSFQGRGNPDKTVSGPVEAALQFYNLYIIAPAMGGDWIFHEYIDPADGPTFAWLLDVEDFYEKGPGIAGETVSYDNYEPLLDDVLRGMRDRANGGPVAADFRFGHAETIIPLAALLRLPGSEAGVPADEVMDRSNSAWRGDAVSPMAANIQWDEFQNTAGETIVRMLYNEAEIPFHAGCEPIAEGSRFYTLDELESCLPLGASSDHAHAHLGTGGGAGSGPDSPGPGSSTSSARLSSALTAF